MKRFVEGCPASAPMRQNGEVEGGEDFWPIVAIEGAKMGQKSEPVKQPADQVVKEIRRATRRQFSANPRKQLGERYGLTAGGKWIRTICPPS